MEELRHQDLVRQAELEGQRDQVGAADQRRGQPIEVGDRPEPTGSLHELPGPDRVLTDEHDLGVPCM
ncbi:MAG TPA: hypothetical protein VKO35_07460 [Acidimicrobiia bacterium]|nr:hypothetical protein [Acidimicrobiia bacterium]